MDVSLEYYKAANLVVALERRGASSADAWKEVAAALGYEEVDGFRRNLVTVSCDQDTGVVHFGPGTYAPRKSKIRGQEAFIYDFPLAGAFRATRYKHSPGGSGVVFHITNPEISEEDGNCIGWVRHDHDKKSPFALVLFRRPQYKRFRYKTAEEAIRKIPTDITKSVLLG